MEALEGPVGIVGMGLMGTSLALSLRRHDPALELVAIDSDPAHASAAAARLGSAPAASLADLNRCRVVVLAVPVGAMREVLLEVAPHVRSAAVTDVASVKVAPERWAREAAVDLYGGHPMCGRELSGPSAADERLYDAAPWILTRRHPLIDALVRAAGASAVDMSSEEHDRLVAGVSHAAFVVAAAYTLAAGLDPDWERMAAVASSGYRDVTRVAAGDPALYAAIAAANAANLDHWLGRVAAELESLREAIRSQDTDAIAARLGPAAEIRRRWEREPPRP